MNAYVPTARLRINARDEDWWQGNTTDTLTYIASTAAQWGRYGTPSVYLPYEEGDPWWMPKEGWRLTWPMEVYGDGINEAWGLRYWADPLVPDLKGTQDSNGLVLCTRAMHIHDLTISNDRGPVSSGTGNGLMLDFSSQPSHTSAEFQFERLHILYAGNDGVNFDPVSTPDLTGYILLTTMRDCYVYGCTRHGFNLERASTTMIFEQVSATMCGGCGWRVIDCETSKFDGVVSENNGHNTIAGREASAFYMRGVESSKVRLHVEEHTNGAVRDGLVLDNCNSITVESGMIAGTWNPNTKGWNGTRLRNGTRNCVIMPQRCTDYATNAVIGDSTVSGCTIFKQERPVSGIDWKKNTRLWS